MGRGGRPDAGQAAIGRGGSTSWIEPSSLAQRAAAILGAPSAATAVERGSLDPNNITRVKPVNMARTWTEEEIRRMDPLLQLLTGADPKMIQAYGNTIRQNNGTYLDGGIANDKYWQDLHR